MKRVDVYSGVHKMQRARLFELTVAAGRLDPADRAGRTELAVAVRAVVEELAAHADHEETFIHPSLRRVAPGIATDLECQHGELDTALDDLRHAAAGGAAGTEDPTTLYRALASFTARYLDHLAVEESAALPALWAACDDDELAGILAVFRSSRSDAENLAGVLAQLPTLNPTEAQQLLQVGLATVSEHDVGVVVATLLDPRARGALDRPSAALPARH
jgi:hypothetical protein